MSRICIACGGTGGHINPAVAVADALRSEGHTLSLIVSGTRSAEAGLIRDWQGPLLRSGARPIKDPRNLLAILRCRRFLRQQRPEVLFATGGYTSFAPVVAARWLGIPVVLHEANSLAGKAVKFLARHFRIATVATSFEGTAAQLPGAHTVFTGLPLRASVLQNLERARAVAKQPGSFHVLVTGGSQGARGLNLLVAPLLASLAKSDPEVRVLHQCGTADLDAMQSLYGALPNVTVVPFVEDMGTAYGEADIVIARAGAATCFEIARCAIPAIFVPLPTAMDDHQTKNAEALVASGGAICVNQLTTTSAQMAEILRTLYSDPALRESMHRALTTLPQPDATQRVVEVLLSAIPSR